ncbi:MAG TPA: sigma-70 family RNA polymerase sigma factor [Candidatus Pristimantibacillus sp.]|jgi:RNA polymerase sigma-70 factor (ECF subfamily)|nr:sigma-70 family RNA polymerase sigma factor [Candidatus Pristimantibacillus sp.]
MTDILEVVPQQRRVITSRILVGAGEVILQPAEPADDITIETGEPETAEAPATEAVQPVKNTEELPPPSSGAAAEAWELIQRAKTGDQAAFSALYSKHAEAVLLFIDRRVGNRTLAQDLAADTFLRAWKRIPSFVWQGKDIGAWLVTIARNRVADYYKSGLYRFEVSAEFAGHQEADRSPEGRPEETTIGNLTNAALLAAVKQLGSEQRECIKLRFFDGLSIAETAAAMGKNESSIKALQYRAVRSLQGILPLSALR